jgi:hypothetical protein
MNLQQQQELMRAEHKSQLKAMQELIEAKDRKVGPLSLSDSAQCRWFTMRPTIELPQLLVPIFISAPACPDGGDDQVASHREWKAIRAWDGRL